ncbi:MAG: EndoU domain-containing protein [Candidatus Dormibacteraceae bacterium]
MTDVGGAPSPEGVIVAQPPHLRDAARHVLLGGLNKDGRPVGFHHAPGGDAPPGRRIDAILERYENGSYLARVSFFDSDRGWMVKAGPHMMFPDAWSAVEVIGAGFAAYRSRGSTVGGAWSGRARGMAISGRQPRGRPATFYPDRGGRER